MSYISGIIAALLSPLVTTIGFLLWEYFCYNNQNNFNNNNTNWSSFALNLYKCCLATIFFIATIFILSIIHYRHDNDDSNYRFFWSLTPYDDEKTELDYDNTKNVHTKQQIIGYLILSSVIGIIIGDLLWLQALRLLGSVRVIFMDALKPFCATVFGIVILQESFHYTILIGIILTVTGIICMSLDGDHSQSSSSKEPQQPMSQINTDTNNAANDVTPITAPNNKTDTNNNTKPKNKLSLAHAIGYCLSLVNVILDTYGSVLTKQYGIHISVWEINCIRFGFAGGILLLISIGMILYHDNILTNLHNCCCCRMKEEKDDIVVSQHQIKPQQTSNESIMDAVDIATATTNNVISTERFHVTDSETKPTGNNIIPVPAVPWYRIPMSDKNAPDRMTKSMWLYISLGVVFVTYIAPTLYNYALFEISLALTLTLTSIGPFYAIPLSYAVQRYVYISSSNLCDDGNNVMNENTENNQNQQLLQPKIPNQPSKQVWIGAVLTVGGIVLLAYTGGVS